MTKILQAFYAFYVGKTIRSPKFDILRSLLILVLAFVLLVLVLVLLLLLLLQFNTTRKALWVDYQSHQKDSFPQSILTSCRPVWVPPVPVQGLLICLPRQTKHRFDHCSAITTHHTILQHCRTNYTADQGTS